ncbi:MAG: hypothetical protein PVJ26_06880, partial [Anaerolineae bacterium]
QARPVTRSGSDVLTYQHYNAKFGLRQADAASAMPCMGPNKSYEGFGNVPNSEMAELTDFSFCGNIPPNL